MSETLRKRLNAMLPRLALIRCTDGVISIWQTHLDDYIRVGLIRNDEFYGELALVNREQISNFIEVLRNNSARPSSLCAIRKGLWRLEKRPEHYVILNDEELQVLITFIEQRDELKVAPRFWPDISVRRLTEATDGDDN